MDLVGFCLKIATSPQNLMFDYDFLPINVPILESEIAILRYSPRTNPVSLQGDSPCFVGSTSMFDG